MASTRRLRIGRINHASQGRVIAHSKDRDEIHRALKKHTGNLCIHFTGTLPPDTGVIF